ncbi:hypothetical protein AaE_013544 [Aphanomyces astaci]|uniref:Uncharacterized protein n=1 Tax=Aphanomyces astaci TaxID=112090 RepID=A0A6A4ZBD5_APHAT|nr:hypothetical protein AaE_013544 [Aphanomyces astaci]
MNVLDLGFFRAIQSLQEQNFSRSLMDIVKFTNLAWAEVDSASLNANFLTLQSCLLEVVRHEGNNDYKIPHMKKSALLARGQLPVSVAGDVDTINDGMRLLSDCDLSNMIIELANDVAKDLAMSEFCTELEQLDLEVDDVDDEVDILRILDINIE